MRLASLPMKETMPKTKGQYMMHLQDILDYLKMVKSHHLATYTPVISLWMMWKAVMRASRILISNDIT